MKKRLKNALPYALTAISVIIIWLCISKAQGDEIFFPSPQKVAVTFFSLFKEKSFYIYLKSTLLRVVVSFIVSIFAAILLAYVSKSCLFFKKAFYPLITLSRAVPTISVIFLCYMWFNSQINPIIITSLIIFPTLYSSFLNAFENVDSDLIEMCDVFKVNKTDIFFKLYLPQTVTRVYDDGKNAFSLSIKLIIAAEALSSTSNSLGMIMNLSKSYLEIDKLFAITVVAVLCGVAADGLFFALKKIVLRLNYVKAKKHN